MTRTEHEVSNRSRSWGFGFTTVPSGDGPYGIEEPAEDYCGVHYSKLGLSQSGRRIVSGGVYYRTQVFYQHEPVVDIWGLYSHETDTPCSHCDGDGCGICEYTGHVIEYREGWVIPHSMLSEIRDQFDMRNTIRIRTGREED